jgi:hypothetical protein
VKKAAAIPIVAGLGVTPGVLCPEACIIPQRLFAELEKGRIEVKMVSKNRNRNGQI